MLPGYAQRSEEPEANAFAGEMLMPYTILRSCLDPNELTLAFLDDVSSAFRVTISATIHRVVDVAVHVCALVRSEAGRMKSFHVCNDFPFRIRSMGSQLDPDRVLGISSGTVSSRSERTTFLLTLGWRTSDCMDMKPFAS